MRRISGEQCLMRIFIGDSDRYQRKPLYDALANLFRKNGFAGLTVLRGVAGFGAHSVYHTDKLLELSSDLPIILEVVESRDRIDALMPEIDAMMNGGLVTLETVEVVRYTHCHEGECEE
jgi:PII-like signaling protein